MCDGDEFRRPIEFPCTSDDCAPLYIAAPMVRYSRLTFRRLCRQYGTQLCFTPMLMADSFARSDKCRQVEWVTEPADRPLVAQFAANSGKMLADAAELVAAQCDGIDLNCGCPQRWVVAEGYGSCLLAKPELIADMVAQTRNRLGPLAPSVSVSIKIRLRRDGLDRTVDLCRQAEAAGVDFITVHGRTPVQRGEPSDHLAVATVASSLRVPCVLNGDVATRSQADELARTTGVRGVMAGRALLHNPAMFAGHAAPPDQCIRRWAEGGLSDGVPFAQWHQHLMFMVERRLGKADRREFNAARSVGRCVDFLRNDMGIECDVRGGLDLDAHDPLHPVDTVTSCDR